MANVPQEQQHHMIRILQFLIYSKRPLLLEEAVDIIAVQPSHKPQFDPQNRMPVPGEILKCCSSLVLINTKTRYGQHVMELQLAHFSVKEYLTSNRLDRNISNYFEEINARGTIAETCLGYSLCLEYTLSYEMIIQKYPMATYAATQGITNAVITEEQRTAVQNLSIELFRTEIAWKTFFQLHRSAAYFVKEESSALLYASWRGLQCVVQMLLNEGADVNAEIRGGNETYGNALEAASYGGHEKIVQMLLDKGADINSQSSFYGTALEAASVHGHENIVQILLDKGADIDAQSYHYGTALQIASANRHENIVQILLDKGADIDAQSYRYGTALQAASGSGHEKIVQILLDKGADVNAHGGIYENAFQAASKKGHKKIVQILLDSGASRKRRRH
ncbi:ankyrin repeat protein [Annulohypoxylon stygium]|nr:ankyrin repeat protein [Annulohypoxylon stygium]